MSHIPQQHMALPSEDRRTALLFCFPLALTSTSVTLEYALQIVILYLEDTPRRFLFQMLHLWLLVSYQPLAPETSGLFLRSSYVGLLLLVLLGVFGASFYHMLSVSEDIIRILVPPRFTTKYMPHRLFPRKVFFRLSLPVGIPSLEDMLSSPPHASSQTIALAATVTEDKAVCEVTSPTSLQRVYISLLNTFSLQLEKANKILVAVSMSNTRWIAVLARLATQRRGMESQKISADVSPASSKNPQQWYYKNKDRCNDFFKALARKEDIVEFDAIQQRKGLWYLFDESVDVVIDLDEFESHCQSILHLSHQNENEIDTMMQSGHELISFYGKGYLPELVHDEGFEEWGMKEREKQREMYLKALLHIAKCLETAGQQRQNEPQLAYLQKAAQFYLECAITASDTLFDAECRGESALQKCLELYMKANDIPEAKSAYFHYEQHIKDHLCDTWVPSRATQQLWEKVQEKNDRSNNPF